MDFLRKNLENKKREKLCKKVKKKSSPHKNIRRKIGVCLSNRIIFWFGFEICERKSNKQNKWIIQIVFIFSSIRRKTVFSRKMKMSSLKSFYWVLTISTLSISNLDFVQVSFPFCQGYFCGIFSKISGNWERKPKEKQTKMLWNFFVESFRRNPFCAFWKRKKQKRKSLW